MFPIPVLPLRFPQKNSLDGAAHVGLELNMRIVQMWGKMLLLPGPAFLPVPAQLMVLLAGSAQFISELLPASSGWWSGHLGIFFSFLHFSVQHFQQPSSIPRWVFRVHMKIAVTEILSGTVSIALSLLPRRQKCLCCSPRVLCLLRSTAHFSEVFSPFTLFPRRWQESFFALALQHNPLRDLKCCTWPSHSWARWEQACSVSLPKPGRASRYLPLPHYLPLHSSLIYQCSTTSSLKNMIALLSTSVPLCLGITQLNPFGVLSVYSSWILNYFFPLNR